MGAGQDEAGCAKRHPEFFQVSSPSHFETEGVNVCRAMHVVKAVMLAQGRHLDVFCAFHRCQEQDCEIRYKRIRCGGRSAGGVAPLFDQAAVLIWPAPACFCRL